VIGDREVKGEGGGRQAIQRKIDELRRDYAAWHEEHGRWLEELKQWRRDQDRLEALLYKLEHILDEEAREFEVLMESIENHEKLLNANERTLEFYLESDRLEPGTFDHIVEAHDKQKRWEERLGRLHDRLQNLHLSIMEELHAVLKSRPRRP